MAVTVTTTITTVLAGLGNEDTLTQQFTAATSTLSTHLYGKITTTNTAQILDLGSVVSVKGIWLKAISYDLGVDTSWVTPTYEAQIVIPAGQVAYFVPAGAVYVKNNTAGEVPYFEYLVVG